MDFFKLFDITGDELSEIIFENPSLRGFILGYIGEYKLRKFFLSDKRISNLKKYDDHDRTKKSDIVLTYKKQEFSIEVKSLQSSTVKCNNGIFIGKAQCDASDRRSIVLPDSSKIITTCLLIGEFDLLAVNIFSFNKSWKYLFAINQELPRSKYKGYSEYQRNNLISSLIEVTYPPKPPFYEDPFPLLDKIIMNNMKQKELVFVENKKI